jgi:hypothetical protein
MSPSRVIWAEAIAACAIVLIVASSVLGEIPSKINYQGQLVDVGGAALSGEHSVVFRIFDFDTGGTQLWTESQTIEADSSGVFWAVLGSVDSIDAGFDGPRWLEVEVDGEILAPRREMVSVPFAFQAANAHMVAGLHTDAFADSAHGHNALDAADGSPAGAVFVDGAGNAGVGTQAPEARLDVAGTARVSGFEMPTGAAAGSILTSDAAGAGTWQAPQAAIDGDWILSGGDMYSGVPGDVGIGTSNPTSALHVRRDQNGQVGIAIENRDPGSGSGERLSFNDENGGVAGILTHDNDYPGFPNGMSIFNNRAGGGIGFGISGGTDLVRMVSGRVGIRALAPQAYLHVRGEAAPAVSLPASTVMVIEDEHGPALNFLSANTGMQSIFFGDPDDIDVGGLTYSHSDNALSFRTGGAKRATIAGDGRVGIGVDQPANPLHVYGTGGSSGGVAGYGEVVGHFTATGSHTAISVDAAAANLDAILYLGKESAAYWDLRNDSDASNSFQLRHQGGTGQNVPHITVTGDGKIGIGTTVPKQRLHIYDGNGGLTFPIKLENIGSTSGTATGILFKVDGGSADAGKGAIVYERKDTYNRGAIRFLQRRDTSTEPARIADAVMTIANNGMVYIGLGWAGEPRYRLQVVDQNDSASVGLHNGNYEHGTALIATGNASVGELLDAGSGLAATGSRYGVFANTSTLGDNDQAGVYAKLNRDNQQASLCYRSAAGTKYKVYGDGIASSIMQTSTGRVNLACPESPEAWIEDYGSGEIKAGACHVELDPTYLECIAVDGANPLKVFVQLTSPIEQQYYVKKGTTGFDVIVVGSGAGEAGGTFDYRVVGKWRGYETFRFERATEPPAVIEVSTADSQQ